MGILNVITKPFKAIGKAFKWVGKQIMKGFGKLGKFMNKFGILLNSIFNVLRISSINPFKIDTLTTQNIHCHSIGSTISIS